MNITTLSSLFNWLTLFLATIQFRKGYLAQGIKHEDLPFNSIFMPYAAYYGVGMVSFFICRFFGSLPFFLREEICRNDFEHKAYFSITVISGFDVFFPEKWSVADFFANVSFLHVAN